MSTLTLKTVREELRKLGITIKKTGEDDELRVNFSGGKEATACYTNDLADALGSGRDMATRRDYGGDRMRVHHRRNG